MANKPNSQNQTNKGLINIVVEDGLLLAEGDATFDMGKVVDSNIANKNDVTAVERTLALVDGSGTPFGATPTWEDHTNSLVLCSILPTIGGKLGQQRVQLAFKDQLVKVVGDAYSNIGLNECDLIKLFMYCEGLASLLMVMALGLKLSEKQSAINAVVCERALRLYGFDYSEITTERERYINAYNRLAKLINEHYYLAENKAIREYMYLISHIFADSNSQKAQLILFRPVIYTSIDFTDGTVEPEITLWQDELTVDLEPSINLTKIVSVIELAERFANSAWYSQVAPYLYHIYGDRREGLINFADYDYKPMSVVFNYSILDAIRNSKVVNRLKTPDSTIAGKCRIFENSGGFIQQGGNIGLYEGLMVDPIVWGESGGTPVDVISNMTDAMINVDGFPSGNADKINALAFYFDEDTAVNGGGTPLDNGVTNYITYCSHVLLLRKTNVRFADTSSGWTYTAISDGNYVNKAPSLSGLHYGQRYIGAIINIWSNVTSDNTTINKLEFAVSFNSSGKATSCGVKLYVHDKDNMFTVAKKDVRNFYVQQTYDMMWFRTPEFRGRK